MELTDLKKERKKKGLSQKDICRIGEISRSSVSGLDCGRKKNTTIDTLERYALALGMRIVWTLKD